MKTTKADPNDIAISLVDPADAFDVFGTLLILKDHLSTSTEKVRLHSPVCLFCCPIRQSASGIPVLSECRPAVRPQSANRHSMKWDDD